MPGFDSGRRAIAGAVGVAVLSVCASSCRRPAVEGSPGFDEADIAALKAAADADLAADEKYQSLKEKILAHFPETEFKIDRRYVPFGESEPAGENILVSNRFDHGIVLKISLPDHGLAVPSAIERAPSRVEILRSFPGKADLIATLGALNFKEDASAYDSYYQVFSVPSPLR